MQRYADTIGILSTMPDTPEAQPEAMIPTLDADAAWQWVLDLMGDAANDRENPLAKLFKTMLAAPPMDVDDLEQQIRWQAVPEQRALGATITRVIGNAVLVAGRQGYCGVNEEAEA